MKRLLLLMSTKTYKAQAFLEAAEHLGQPVVVGTDRRQSLSHLDPEGNLTLDFRNPGRTGHKVVEFAERVPLAGIVAADDEGVELAATVAPRLGLRYSTLGAVKATRNKRLMRDLLSLTSLNTPSYLSINSGDRAKVLRKVSFPCVVKPVGLSASRGVVRADSESGFIETVARIRKLMSRPDTKWADDEILVEDFIPGREVALEGLLKEGKLRVLAIFDKPDPLDGPFFEETIYVTPSRLDGHDQTALVSATARAAEALGLNEGPVHAELRLNDEGAWLLEIAARSIGGLCSRALRFADGISLEELILKHTLDRDTDGILREEQASGVMMIPVPRAGTLREIAGVEAAEAVDAIDEIRISIPPGQSVEPAPEGSRYLGFIFARAATPERVEEALREAHSKLDIQIESGTVDEDSETADLTKETT